jgi:4-amino-4-deoxy-L-arabinose transferase-like glycosyltransferase
VLTGSRLSRSRPAQPQPTGWDRNWRRFVAAAFLLGLVIRLVSVLVRPHLAPAGDPLEYVGQANLLVEGKGWIEPLVYAHTGAHLQTAKLPPLFTLLMAMCSVVGLKSFFAHRIWSAILGSLAVPVAAGLGKEVGGRKVAVLAAFGIAVYPNMWMSDGLAMSETVSPILTMLVLWAAYRMWRRPSRNSAALLGLSIGFAALARDELILFAVLILLPVALLAGSETRAERFRLAGVGVAGVVLVVAPWVGFNLSRFSHPVLISDRFGVTFAAANCDSVWHGPLRGFWSMPCAFQAAVGVHGDESAVDPVALRHGLHYVGHHMSGYPSIEVARLGRTFGFYRPGNQIRLDSFIEGRPLLWARVGLGMFYAFAALAVAGGVMLRRRRALLFPMIAVVVDVVVAVLLTYGQTRFRAPLEPVLVILSAVALVEGAGGVAQLRRRWRMLRRALRVRALIRRVPLPR